MNENVLSSVSASKSASLTTDLASYNVSSNYEKDGMAHALGHGRSSFGNGKNVITGREGSTLTGTDKEDLFVIKSPGVTINDFQIGRDKLAIYSKDETLSYFDLVNPFPFFTTDAGTVGQGTAAITSTLDNNGTVVRVPIGSRREDIVTLNGVSASALVNSPESFEIYSPGNVAIDWNEITFDAQRIAGVPPAASTRTFALVHTAIQDAVQGVLKEQGRSTYLESIGETLPTLSGNASAAAAAASAAHRVLTSIFTDPNNPVSSRLFTIPSSTEAAPTTSAYFTRVFDTALNVSLGEIRGSASAIAKGKEFGEKIADALLNLRKNDGAFRNEDGTPVNFAAFNNEYQNGIETNEALNEPGFQDAPSKLLNRGTVGRLSDGTTLIGSEVPVEAINQSGTKTVTSIARTTPGAWRRSEDTLDVNGNFAGLASPEIASLNQSWVLPSTDFFNNNILPPPALDSERYVGNVAEVKNEGSILDLPGSGTVSVLNRTTTTNGVTRYIGTSTLGESTNDTDLGEQEYGAGNEGNDFGRQGTDKLGLTSADRTIIAHVWANAEGSYGPNYAWQKVTQQLARNNNSSLADTAYIFGSLNMALSDGFASIWDIKWDKDYFWRPVSSIRNADQLGSTGFLDDDDWTPREVTPQHPCHPSGTSMTAGLASTILANFYGDAQTFTVGANPHPNSARLRTALQSLNGNDLIDGVPLEDVSKTYTSLSQAADESRTSRIYAGAHFRFATENGVNLGEQVGTYFLRHNPFLKTETTSNVPAATPDNNLLGLIGSIPNFNPGAIESNVVVGLPGFNVSGTDGEDLFVLVNPGVTINNFQVGVDKLAIISNDKPLTFLDIVNPYLTGGLTDTANGVVVRTPDGARRDDYATLRGVTAAQLVNSPESFVVISKGNVVIDWNEVAFDAGRIAGVPPAASTRTFALVQTAIADAVQAITKTTGRQTYLESIGQTLPNIDIEASAEAAAASAARTILSDIFTDPDNPISRNNFTPITGSSFNNGQYFSRVFDAAYDTSLAELRIFNGVSEEAIAAGASIGREIAQRLLDLRRNDGAFRNADGTRVNLSEFNTEYQDGIEPNTALNEVHPQDAPSKLLNNGTVGRLSDGTILIGTEDPVTTVSSTGTTTDSIAKTTPGAWRRGEDTLRADGTFAPLASPEIASLNQAWVLPSTNFFNDNILPPPALDSERYRRDVAEVKADGSINDIPGSSDVSILNRTVTVDGKTTYIGTSNYGTAANDTNPEDSIYNDFGRKGADGLGTTSAERTIIAHVWANAEGSYGPNYAWQKVLQQLAINNNSSVADTAYIFGFMNMALSDGFANIWDIKWDKDYFWRPVSSIRNADQLASTADLDDNGWTPREGTPQHPCHPSGTSMTAGLASTILANFYGDDQTFTVSADPHPNSARLLNALKETTSDGLKAVDGVPLEQVSRTYTSLSQAADESRTSRIYAGAHFRFATENGVNLGEQVASYYLRHNPFVVPQTV
jgi:Vanadium chloroperoxidase N-terminal domain